MTPSETKPTGKQMNEAQVAEYIKWLDIPYDKDSDLTIEEVRRDSKAKFLSLLSSSSTKGRQRITLCGSTKFKKEFEAINRQLSLEGYIVYSVAFFGHADAVPLTKKQKERLDEVHKRKIDNSDAILVLDVDGYIGESTRSEIDYAERTGKTVKYLSSFPDLKYICDATLFNKSEK